MTTQNHNRQTLRFAVKGLQLAKTLDLLDPSELAIAQNLRQFIIGQLQTRSGLSQRNASAMTGLIVHTIRRLNNDLVSASQTNCLVVGNDTRLDTSNAAGTSFTNRATGFSGNPLSLIPFRPEQSPEPWMYVGDSVKMGKTNVAGTFRNQGVAPSTAPPTGPGGVPVPALNAFQQVTIDSGINTQAAWTSDGVLFGAPVNNQPDAALAIATALYDVGTTGWANVVFTPVLAPEFYQVGVMIKMNTAVETVTIDSVYKPIKTTTISSITYDSGSTGLCTIQPVAHKRKALIPNNIILINSGGGTAEYVRVLSVSFGDDDQPSFRCSTVNTHAAAETLTGVVSWRAFFANNHAAAETFQPNILGFPGLGQAAGTTITGYNRQTIALDLSNVSGRPIQDDDVLNFIIRINSASGGRFIEIQVMLDCGDGSFSQNYFFVPLRPSDFTPVSGLTPTGTTLDTRQRALQNTLIDEGAVAPEETPSHLRERLQRRLAKATVNGNLDRVTQLHRRLAALDPQVNPAEGNLGTPTSSSLQIGAQQYVPVRIKIKDISRVGTDFTKGWANIVKVQVRATMNNPTAGVASADLSFGSFWIGGSFGPDAGEIGTPYLYRYTYRASESGARSNPSPATRTGVIARRQRVQLVAAASADAQVDKIDWYRFGGSLNEWHYIGTGPNTTATFNDDFPDDVVAASPLINFGRFQPFPVEDVPHLGTGNAAGTAVTRTAGDLFNLAWAPGAQVIVNGVSATLYRVISTSLLEVIENLGALTGVSLFIPDATIQGQPLPAMWGPFGEGQIGAFMFACGAVNQPGTLFWTNGNDPDSADERNQLELTSPSEPLMNGCVYDGQAFVWSNERMFAIQMVQGLEGLPEARAREIPNGKGLFARFAFAVGPKIWFVAEDGIYETIGGEPQLVTADLYPLFPHDGQPGITVNGIVPPDFTLPNSMRLAYADGMVYFDYVDTGAARRTLVFNTLLGGWSLDVYTPTAAVHYQEEGRGVHSVLLGGTDGRVYQLLQSSTTDNGTAIACALRTGAFDARNFRAQKTWADLIVDYLAAVSITTTAGFDNYTSLTVLTALAVQATRDQVIRDLNSGEGILANNIALDLVWSGQAQLFGWEPSWLGRPEDAIKRVTDVTDGGFKGAKWFYGVRIKADTRDSTAAVQSKTVQVQSDNGTAGVMTTQAVLGGGNLTVRHDGESWIDYPFDAPFIGHLVRLLPNDANQWKLYEWEWLFDPEPPLVTDYVSQFTTDDAPGYYHFRDGQLAYRATADITLTMVLDGTTYTYTLTHNSGAYTKFYLPFQAIKFKHRQLKFHSSAGFRLYRRDSWLNMKPWGLNVPYQRVNAFGEVTNLEGPRI